MQVLRERTDEEPAFALVLCAPDLEELDGEV
jgi:hypothetical protein